MKMHFKMFLYNLCITQCPAMLSSKRWCALHCACSFTWSNTQGWSTTGHPWACKHKISLLWCSAIWLLQDVHATQKTVTLQFNHLFHNHNYSVCDWVWLTPEKLLLTLGLPIGMLMAMLMPELVQSNCYYHLRDRIMPAHRRWIHRGFSRHCYCSPRMQPHATTAQFYQDLSQSSPLWQSYAFPSM